MVTAALAEPRATAGEAVIAPAAGETAATTPATTPSSSWPTYLLQFIHRYLDMREAEAQACAALAGVPRDALPLEMPPAASASLSRPAGKDERDEKKADGNKNGGATFRTVRLPGPEAAAEILRRSMLVRCILDVWGEGDSMESLCEDLKRRGAVERAKGLFDRRGEGGGPLTWRLSVDGFGVNVGTQATTLEACKRLSFLQMPGRVSLDDPDFVLRLIVIGGDKEAEVEEVDEEGDESKRQQRREQQRRQSRHPSLLDPCPSPRRFVLGLEVGTRIRHPKADEGEVDGGRRATEARRKRHARDRSRVLSELSLDKRPYIGPTSMDAEVAAIMCNLALVKKGSVVFDPCVGTGSILVAAAAAGAHVVGADIDLFALVGRPAARAVRPLKKEASVSAAKFAKGKEGRRAAAAAVAGASVGLLDNFEEYRLPRPAGVLVADMSRLPFRKGKSSPSSSSSTFCFEGAFDAIIADPPYGVRAGGRKQAAAAVGDGGAVDGGAAKGEEADGGAAKGDEADVDGGGPPSPPPSTASSSSRRPRGPARANARFRAEGAPAPTRPYDLGECLWDLLRLAASSLSVDGRLVFFLPSRPGAGPDTLPSHPCLRAVSDCEQPLSRWYCRRLVTMEKWRSFDDAGGEEAEAAARESEGNAAAFAAASAVASGVYGEYAAAEVAGADDAEEADEGGEGKQKKKKKGGGLGALRGRGKCV